MNIQSLKNNFIYLNKEFEEGEVFLFFKLFKIDKTIKSARFLGTAFGVYDAYLNDQKIGEQLFKPGYTYYKKRLLYQEYDLKEIIKDGTNELKIYLSQGWYSGRFFCENTVKNYGDHPSLSYMLEIEFDDGKVMLVTSEEDDAVYSSEYDYAGEYDGEIIDERKKIAPIGKASRLNEPNVALEPTLLQVKIQEEMQIQAVFARETGAIIDFGQNFAGIISINPQYLEKGQTITIKHGEILNDDGSLYTENLRKAKATLCYTKGDFDKVYTPRFTYMGFRYIEISGVKYQSGLIRGNAICTDMERTGCFQTANTMVDKLFNNIVWGQKSNYVEIPTDCPQRDERLGYTGDGHVFALTGSYNFNVLDFWRNYFRDLVLGQNENPDGNVPPYLPQVNTHPVGFLSMQGWGSAVSIIPEIMYHQYGDEVFFCDQYEAIKKYVDLEIRKSNKKHLWKAISLGDWLSLGKGIAWQAMNNHPISNAFFVNDLRIVTSLASKLGKEADFIKYSKQYESTKKAYINAFIKRNGKVKKDYQGTYVLALKHVLTVEDDIRPLVIQKFITNVKRNGISTGFFGTEHLLSLLADFGEAKLAYDLLLSKKCPGWMYQIERGATTVWERWDAIKEDGKVNETKTRSDNMVSFNHYSFGSVGEFFYQYILGIKPLLPGYEEIIIKPYIDERLGSVKGTYKSCNGIIESAWKYDNDSVCFDFSVPAKTTIVLPDGSVHFVDRGDHCYVIDQKKIR